MLCFRIAVSLWNLTGMSAALLPTGLSTFRAIGKIYGKFSSRRDLSRFGVKRSTRLVCSCFSYTICTSHSNFVARMFFIDTKSRTKVSHDRISHVQLQYCCRCMLYLRKKDKIDSIHDLIKWAIWYRSSQYLSMTACGFFVIVEMAWAFGITG